MSVGREEVGWPVVVAAVVMAAGLSSCDSHTSTSGQSASAPTPVPATAPEIEPIDPLCAKIIKACPSTPQAECKVVEEIFAKDEHRRLGKVMEVTIGYALWYVAEDGTALTANAESVEVCPGMPFVADEVRARARKAASMAHADDPTACSAKDVEIASYLEVELEWTRGEYAHPGDARRATREALQAIGKKHGMPVSAVQEVWKKALSLCPEAL